MTLSVVIPTRNTRALTEACLDSLAASGAAVEIVVVDEASTDGTAAMIAARHPTVIVLKNSAAAGFSAAANRGLRAASGDLLLLLNSDTEVLTGALGELVRAFDAQAALGVAGAQLRFPDGRPQWSGGAAPRPLWLFALATGLPAALTAIRERLPRSAPTRRRKRQPVEWVTGAALAMRREVWETCGPLDESYEFYAQDLDLCLRAAAAGWAVQVVPGFVVVHHQGATIAAAGSGLDRQNVALLWRDLVRWTAKSQGNDAARRARTALVTGAAIRLAARRLWQALLILSPRRRPQFVADSAALAAARRGLLERPAGADPGARRSR